MPAALVAVSLPGWFGRLLALPILVVPVWLRWRSRSPVDFLVLVATAALLAVGVQGYLLPEIALRLGIGL